MKSLLPKSLLIAALFSSVVATSQITVTIGNGTSSGTSSPIASFYNSSATESIYTGTEIGTTGLITNISYNKASGASTTNPNVKIYMKTTSLTTLGTTNYSIGNLGSYTLVFDGALPNDTASGIKEVALSTPFRFTDVSQNLSVLVVGTTCISSGRPQYRYTTTATKMSAGYTDGSIGCGGTSNFDGTSTLSPVWERPNIILKLGALSTEGFETKNNVIVSVNQNKLFITSERTALKNISLFDLTGRSIHFSTLNSNTSEIDLSGLRNQIIVAKITTEDNTIMTKKILL